MRLSLQRLATAVALVAALALVSAAAVISLAGCSSAKRAQRLDGGLFPPGLHAPALTLRDERGQAFSLQASDGTVRALVFLPGDLRTETLLTQQVRGALDELGSRGRGVTVLLIGPMPAWRGIRLLRETSLLGRARYLTDGVELLAAWKAYGVPLPSVGERAYLASTSVILVDRSGFERVGFALEQLTPEALAHDIRALLAGA